MDRVERNFNYQNQNISTPVTDSLYYDFLMNDPIKAVIPSLIYDALYLQTDSGKLFYGYVDTKGYVAWTEFTDLAGTLVDSIFGPVLETATTSIILEKGSQDAEAEITKRVEFIPAIVYNRNVAYMDKRGNSRAASLNVVAAENARLILGSGDTMSTSFSYDGSPEIQVSAYEDDLPNGLFIQTTGSTPFAVLRVGRAAEFYGVDER